jgi:hypothetical protein
MRGEEKTIVKGLAFCGNVSKSHAPTMLPSIKDTTKRILQRYHKHAKEVLDGIYG